MTSPFAVLISPSLNRVGEPKLHYTFADIPAACDFLTQWGMGPKGIRAIVTPKGTVFEVVYSDRRDKTVIFIVIKGHEAYTHTSDAALTLNKV